MYIYIYIFIHIIPYTCLYLIHIYMITSRKFQLNKRGDTEQTKALDEMKRDTEQTIEIRVAVQSWP